MPPPSSPSPDPSAPPSAYAATTAILWLVPEQLALVRAIVDRARLKVAGVGSPAIGRAAELAAAFNAAPLDDLRQALTSAEGQVVLLASLGEFASGPRAGEDAHVLAERHARPGNGGVISLLPLPASVLDLESPGEGVPGAEAAGPGVVLGPGAGDDRAAGLESAELASFVPLMRTSPAMRAAADVLGHLGPVHTMSVEVAAGAAEGDLGARMFDALDLITSLMGEPDAVDATYVWPGRERIVHPVAGDTLRALSGAMTANLRFPDGRGASVMAADASVGAARWARRATILGSGGRITITDAGFEFAPVARAEGSAVDRWTGGLEVDDAAGPAPIFAEQISRLLDPHAAADAPVNTLRVLSVAGAALLSARTGEPESPGTIVRMARTG